MRKLLISDIHANLPALETVLDAATPYDAVLNLGDIVGYGAYPKEVCSPVRKLGGIVVRGSRDRACSGSMHFGEYRNLSWLASYAAGWTQGVLTKENAELLANLRRGPVRAITRKMQCVHWAPSNEDTYIFLESDAWAALYGNRARVVSAAVHIGRFAGPRIG
jgi:Icc-related predicted phosphoesterase